MLVNENLPRQAVERLRESGHDVVWMRDGRTGSSDDEVLRRAQSEGRVLVTMDKDLAALAFRHANPADCGIVLFRIPAEDPKQLAHAVATAMARDQPWRGHLVTVEADRIRIRALPRTRSR